MVSRSANGLRCLEDVVPFESGTPKTDLGLALDDVDDNGDDDAGEEVTDDDDAGEEVTDDDVVDNEAEEDVASS